MELTWKSKKIPSVPPSTTDLYIEEQAWLRDFTIQHGSHSSVVVEEFLISHPDLLGSLTQRNENASFECLLGLDQMYAAYNAKMFADMEEVKEVQI